ncbi:hypothetical protein FRC11_002835, partial [Ceratobasidium sp. 423]
MNPLNALTPHSQIQYLCEKWSSSAPTTDKLKFNTQRKAFLTHINSHEVWVEKNQQHWKMVQEQLFLHGLKHSCASNNVVVACIKKHVLWEEDVQPDDPSKSEVANWETEITDMWFHCLSPDELTEEQEGTDMDDVNRDNNGGQDEDEHQHKLGDAGGGEFGNGHEVDLAMGEMKARKMAKEMVKAVERERASVKEKVTFNVMSDGNHSDEKLTDDEGYMQTTYLQQTQEEIRYQGDVDQGLTQNTEVYHSNGDQTLSSDYGDDYVQLHH